MTYEHVKEIVEGVVSENGLELIEIQFPRFRARQIVRVFVDKNGGVTLDDCKRVSLRLGEILDIEDPFPSRYTLEVSSPGVDRPLKTAGDFRRNVGRTLNVVVSEGTEETKSYTGVLKKLCGETAVMVTDEGEVEVPFDRIIKGQVCTTI